MKNRDKTSGQLVASLHAPEHARQRAEEELRRSEERFRLLIENASDIITVVSGDGTIRYESPSVERLLGYKPEELVGKNVLEFFHPDDVPGAIKGFTKVIQYPGTTSPLEFRFRHRDGSWRVLEAIGKNLVDDSGAASVVVNSRDITERKRVEAELKRSSEFSRTVLNAPDDAISIIDVHDFSIVAVNSAFLKRHGLKEEQVMGKTCYEVTHRRSDPCTPPDDVCPLMDTVKSGAHSVAEHVHYRAGGEKIYVEVSASPIRDASGNIVQVIHIARDITERKRAEQALQKSEERHRSLAITNELTGLYNRRHFYEVLETEVYRTQRYGPSFALAMLDLDGFKEYNDHFGHTNGDAVLKAFAQTLKSALRKPDTAFRYGGDEFSIILPATDANRAENLIERVRAKWSRVPKAEHLALETPVGFSAGIAQFPENAETADGLVFLADTALYRSKREGGYKTTLVSDLGALASDVLDRATLDQVYALAATVDARDPYTYSHSKRVAAVSEMIGKAIGLPQNESANIHAASLLHDIGKVGVPDSILTKPDKPTDAEWKLIRKHPAEGAGIVGYVKELAALIPVILHHHERHDGTGYPHGLKGEDIPLGARIISVADAYDTMTTKRQYREVVSQEEALEELRRCSGTQFDPELVEALCRAINEAAKAALGTVVQ